MPARRVIVFLTAFLASGGGIAGTVGAAGVEAECSYSYTARPGLPSFLDYPAARLSTRMKPPRVGSGEARLFRSALKDGAAAGVNFGGRYTIAGWGCGASCLHWAVIDRRTGDVRFDRRNQIVSTIHVGGAPPRRMNIDMTFDGLRFRPDSSLLILQGAPGEDAAREGLTFLAITHGALRQVAFVPAAKLCGTTKPGPP